MMRAKYTLCEWLRLQATSQIVLLSFAITALAAGEDLPSESKLLLEKLNAFENKEWKKFEGIVSEKTDQVVKVLEAHLERETKSGNLERAIALREKIQELSKSRSDGRDQSAKTVIPPDAKRFRSSGYYILSIHEGGISFVEASALAREKGGEVFIPKSRRDVEAMLEILGKTRCWMGLKYDQNTKKLVPYGDPPEQIDPEDIGIEKIEFNPDNIGHEIFLATNGSGGFKVARKVPVVKSAVMAVMIYFENPKR